MEKESIAKAPTTRPKRASVTTRSRLNVKNKDPNFIYRVVNDTDDRIDVFRNIGYEVVDGAETVGESRVSQPRAEGTVKQVSVGKGQKAYLMKIKKEWFEEDQKTKQIDIDRQEATIKKPKSADYGQITATK